MTAPSTLQQIGHWVRAWRLPAQLNLIFPSLLGLQWFAPCGTPWAELPVGKALALSFLLQWVIMTSNEAADAATDDARARTLISGGAGVGAVGALSPQALQRGAVIGAALGLVASFWLGGPAVMLAWLAALALIWAYDGPLRLSRHPLGSCCQALGVGIVMPWLTSGLVQPWGLPSAMQAVPGLLLGLSGHILTALPDAQTDRRSGKVTLVVRLGPSAAHRLMLAGFALAGAVLALGMPASRCELSAGMPTWTVHAALGLAAALLCLAALPLAWIRQSSFGLPRHLWLAALASIILWSTCIIGTP